MPDHDLFESLGNYGAYLEAESGERLRPSHLGVELLDEPDDAPLTTFGTASTSSAPRSRRVLAAAAAIMVLVAGVAAARWITDAGGPAVDLAVESDGSTDPLFLLPRAGSGAAVSGGWIDTGQPQSAIVAFGGGILGRRDGEGFVDLVAVYAAIDPDLDLTDTDVFERIGSTSMYRRIDQPGVPPMEQEQIAERRGDVIFSLSTFGEPIADPAALFERVRLDNGRAISFDDTDDLMLIGQWPITDDVVRLGFTTYELSVGGNDYVVESARSTVYPGLSLATRAEPLHRGDTTSWYVEVEGEPYGVIWQVTPTHAAFVGRSGDESQVTTREDLIAVAESLEIVDRTSWETALPEAVGVGES